jgi:hypothetical protein
LVARLSLDNSSVESYTIETFSCQNGFMPFVTSRAPLILSDEQRTKLEALRRSRSEESSGFCTPPFFWIAPME